MAVKIRILQFALQRKLFPMEIQDSIAYSFDCKLNNSLFYNKLDTVNQKQNKTPTKNIKFKNHLKILLPSYYTKYLLLLAL